MGNLSDFEGELSDCLDNEARKEKFIRIFHFNQDWLGVSAVERLFKHFANLIGFHQALMTIVFYNGYKILEDSMIYHLFFNHYLPAPEIDPNMVEEMRQHMETNRLSLYNLIFNSLAKVSALTRVSA